MSGEEAKDDITEGCREGYNRVETLAEAEGKDSSVMCTAGNLFKRVKHSDCECMAEDFVCPISHNLPIDPVIASDGKIYERKEIEDYIKRQGRNIISPCTTQKMARDIVPALCVLNNIETGVASGIYSGELAETWKQRMKMKRDVDDAKKNAGRGDIDAMRNLEKWYREGINGLPVDEFKAREWKDKAQVKTWKDLTKEGDAEAMYELGVSYHEGSHGLGRDDAAAYNWYKNASKAGCVMATAVVGDRLISGTGTPRNIPSGLILLACAAKDGSDYACYSLGEYYFKGSHGVAKDFGQAKYWLEMAVGEDCRYQHITESYITTARRWIRKIQEVELGKEDMTKPESSCQPKSASLVAKKNKRACEDDTSSIEFRPSKVPPRSKRSKKRRMPCKKKTGGEARVSSDSDSSGFDESEFHFGREKD